jgi:uncharacterized Zn-finger protein
MLNYILFVIISDAEEVGVQKHHCPVCGKPFSRKFNMREHMKIHTGEKPHQCQICHKHFLLKGNLTKHMVVHLNVLNE